MPQQTEENEDRSKDIVAASASSLNRHERKPSIVVGNVKDIYLAEEFSANEQNLAKIDEIVTLPDASRDNQTQVKQQESDIDSDNATCIRRKTPAD